MEEERGQWNTRDMDAKARTVSMETGNQQEGGREVEENGWWVQHGNHNHVENGSPAFPLGRVS